MLLLDRFLCADGSALDLATGVPVRTRVYARARPTAMFAFRAGWRLVDAGVRSPRAFIEVWMRAAEVPAQSGVSIDAVRAALHDARDGYPRAVDIVAEDAAAWRRTTLDIARESRLAGFVPVAASVLGELLRATRWQWPGWLGDRSLVVLTCDGQVPGAGAVALLRLATRDARPHIVIRGATGGLSVPTRLAPVSAMIHDQGSADWEPPEDSTCESLAGRAWRAAAEEGRSDDETTAAARWAVMLAPTTDAEVTARAALAVTLTAQGRLLEARAAIPGTANPALCSQEADRRLSEAHQRLSEAEQPRHAARALTDDFLHLLEACQAVEDERTTIGQVIALLRDRVAAAGVACVTVEHNQARIVAQVGSLPADAAAALKAVTTGLAHPPEDENVPTDGAWPIRYGGAVVGALWCRWSFGHTVRPSDADALLRVASVAIAPAVHAAVDRGRALSSSPDIPDLVGQSEPMARLRASVQRAACSPFNVLIEGESGSGKELVARAVHRLSPRRDRRFAALNCAALGEELAEAELFGHARGAFTGAVAERAGLFEESTGGTLFLDEVSELSPRVQAKLLRVLQEHEVRRLGESHVRPIDTRVVAATNKPLAEEVQGGRFRRDLRYRLDVVRLSIPPLRERLEDLPELVRHIWSGLAQKTGSRAVLSPGILAALGRYDWPGNVRELQNVLASLIVSSAPRGSIPASQLPSHVGRSAALADTRSLASARREFELRFVRAALARADGRAARAARELGVSRQGLAKVLARLGLRDAGSRTVAPRV
jgi:two-component system response regulator HydG